MNIKSLVKNVAEEETVQMEWGELTWLIGSAANMSDAEQTFGVVKINPGKRNHLHTHPNCEEILYVLSGECDHKLGDEMIKLKAGSVIRIPKGIKHWAKCTSEEPLVAVISFSSPDRQTVNHEDDISL